MFKLEASHEIDFREDFSLLCNWRRLYRAVEIGTDRAEFATNFLRGWTGNMMLCIDPYAPYDEMPWPRDLDYAAAGRRLECFPQVRLLRSTSSEVAKRLADPPKVGEFQNFKTDFVYIDGDHSKEAVAADIRAWWDLLTPIGVLAGHDFDEEHSGVQEAVIEFGKAMGVTVYVTAGTPPSWYIYRNEPGHDWKRVTWR